MELFVVRHARAGSRHRWDGPDELRPLTRGGRRQAAALVDLLGPIRPATLRSSPYRRCVETLEPLGAALGRTVRLDDRLAEGRPADGILDLAADLAAPAVCCTHGDVLEDLLGRLAGAGVPLETDRIEKGATWVLQLEGGEVVKARYLPPPT